MTKVDGRQIEFTVRATEGAKEIGAGSHSRVVIDVAKFTRRLALIRGEDECWLECLRSRLPRPELP